MENCCSQYDTTENSDNESDSVGAWYLSVTLHQHNVTDYEGLHVAAGVNQLGRAERAGRTMHGLERRGAAGKTHTR